MLVMFLFMKEVYVLQPYEVGSKYNKSLALVIPAKVVKRYKINPSTVIALTAIETAIEKDGLILLRTRNDIATSLGMEELASASSSNNKSATPVCGEQRGVTNH